MRRRGAPFAACAVAVAAALAVVSCGGDRARNSARADPRVGSRETTPRPSPTPETTLPAGFSAWAGIAAVPTVEVRDTPDPVAPVARTFPAANEFGDPQSFRILGEQRGADATVWYRAQLPVRPNGSMGWIPAAQVSVEGRNQRIVIEVGATRMVLYEGANPVQEWRVAVGTPATPTPVGDFYLWTKWRRDPATSPYGVGVLGLSAFSEALPDWPGGGRVGIHGTSNAGALGKRVSHGCVRVLNRELAPLFDIVALGTPVQIVA